MMDQCRMWSTNQGTSDVDGYECDDGDNADMDAEDEASQADDGSMQNVEAWGRSTRDCEDRTVYLRYVNTSMATQMQRQAMYPKRRLLQSVTKSQS